MLQPSHLVDCQEVSVKGGSVIDLNVLTEIGGVQEGIRAIPTSQDMSYDPS